MTTVRCRCCHREERWGPAVEILQAGGARRPVEPALDAWRTLRAAREGKTGPVVASCSGCGQPMIASDARVPALASWTIHARAGDLRVSDGAIDGPAGVLDVDAAERWLVAQYPVRWLPTAGDVIGVMFVAPLLAVVACWLLGISFLVALFSTGFHADPWTMTMAVFALLASGLLLGAFVSAIERKR